MRRVESGGNGMQIYGNYYVDNLAVMQADFPEWPLNNSSTGYLSILWTEASIQVADLLRWSGSLARLSGHSSSVESPHRNLTWNGMIIKWRIKIQWEGRKMSEVSKFFFSVLFIPHALWNVLSSWHLSFISPVSSPVRFILFLYWGEIKLLV